MTVGVLGGSFNPVHCGHIELARYIAMSGMVDAVWLSLSPSNPLKPDGLPGATDADRCEMLRLAVEPLGPVVGFTDIELDMPRPSYTFKTLAELSRRHPECHFKLIIGSDNWLLFDRWRESATIIRDYGVIIYPRPGYDVDSATLPDGVELLGGAPLMSVSSTEVRQLVAEGEKERSFIPAAVAAYINDHNLYR